MKFVVLIFHLAIFPLGRVMMSFETFCARLAFLDDGRDGYYTRYCAFLTFGDVKVNS